MEIKRLIIFLLAVCTCLGTSASAENYRAYAHSLGDFSRRETNNSTLLAYGGIASTSTLGAAALATLGATSMFTGIGALVVAGGIGGGLIGYKYAKYRQAKPFYTMARIMSYAKDQVSKHNKEACHREFMKFFTSLHKQHIWQSSAEELKRFLAQLSNEGKLENYPTKSHLAFYLRNNIGSLVQQHPCYNDPFLVIAALLNTQELAKQPFTPELFAHIDLAISAYQSFFLFKEVPHFFPNLLTLLKQASPRIVSSFRMPEAAHLNEIARLYQRFFAEELDLSTMDEEAKRQLVFEVNLHNFIASKILKDREEIPATLLTKASRYPHLAELFATVEDDRETDECPICYSAMHGSKARCLTCNNALCVSCLQHHQEINTKASCPYCRALLGEKLRNFQITIVPLPQRLLTRVQQLQSVRGID